MTSEYCLIFNEPYEIFSLWSFLHLFKGAKRMDFVLSSRKWILNLLSTNQSQMFEKCLLSCSIILMSLCWEIRPVSWAYSRRSQFTACTIFTQSKNKNGSKMDTLGTPQIIRALLEKFFYVYTKHSWRQTTFKPFCKTIWWWGQGIYGRVRCRVV